MRALGATLLAGTLLAGCVSAPPAPSCPAGQEYLHTAQLFFGRNIGDKPGVSEDQFRKFVDDELTPRFPNGLTILDGGGQWRGEGDRLIREAAKVVLVVLPGQGEASKRIEAVRAAYKQKFHQDSVLLVTQSACVSF
jgi:hypothetical protein